MALPRSWQIALTVVALAFGVACGGGDDDGGDGGTSTPGGVVPGVPTPAPRWPEVARAKVATDDLNVRSGPGGTYPVVGRLQPDDDVPVSGRLAGGEWLALPGLGWVVHDPEWTQLSVDFAALPAIGEADQAFEFAGPVHAADARAGIPVVDQVVSAIASRDRTLLVSLATAAPPAASATGAPPSATPDLLPTSVATLVPDVTEVPASATATTAAPPDCSNDPIPGVQLREFLDALYRTEVPAAARGGDAQGVLRLYGVVRGPVPQTGSADYVVVFAFEHGEGRQIWISPDGRITQFAIPCDPTMPGSLLRVTQGEPFFWFRPAVVAPVRPLP